LTALCKCLGTEETLVCEVLVQLDAFALSTQQQFRIELLSFRMDESFRMSFLFHEKAQHFIDTYRECQPRMDQFLLDLEKTAVELDKMKMGSSISTVAGSSLSAIGSVLTITSLVLAPVTAGVSLVLTASGAGMWTISKVISLITGITEYAVNNHQGKKANNIFKNFMEDVQKIIDCLEQAASSKRPVPHVDEGNINLAATQMVSAGKSISKSTRDFIDAGMAMQALNSEEVATGQPDIRLLAKNPKLAMSKAVRYGSIAITAIYIGVDIAFIFKEGWSLAKGETSEASQLMRCRSALWRSEMQAWKKINEHLLKGNKTYRRNLEILERCS
uniref:Apolipoprotein L n=1 Tax=Pygocentrus nattereri TaxID=42514 RepID=A0A3B4EK21_PYGNA